MSTVTDDGEALKASAHHRHLTDAGNAEHFVAMYGDLVRYDHARGRWLVWDIHRWKPDVDAAVHRMALECVRSRHAMAGGDSPLSQEERLVLSKFAIRSEAKQRLDALLAITRTMKPVTDDGRGWDDEPGLIGVGNGVVILKTGALRDGHPTDKITMSTGIDYDPGALCPRWDRYLREVLDDPEVIAFIQCLSGYALTAEASVDLLVFLLGVGRNGKSTYVEFCDMAFGDYGRIISKHAFMDSKRGAHTTEMADLDGSRFAYCEELVEDKLDSGALKYVSGGGLKRARKMRSDTTTFRQTWLLWLTSNTLPPSTDNSWGFWSRVCAIDFPWSFTGKEDPGLEQTLKAELPGILRWAVEGAHDWYEHGLGEWPESVVEKTNQYRQQMDPLAPLFESGYYEKCHGDIWTPTVNLFKAYQEYATHNNWAPDKRWSDTYLGAHLNAQHTRKRHMVTVADGSSKQMTGYYGIRPGVKSSHHRGYSWTRDPESGVLHG